jgi:hypothetical protein
MKTQSTPQLAPPGAGLPWVELQVARILFGIRRWMGNRDSFLKTFEAEQVAIRALIERFPLAERGRPILIPRAVGLEDSSRNYSPWMVLDHLRIVNDACVEVIAALTIGNTMSGSASTAAVKPDPSADASVEAAYEVSCQAVVRLLQTAGDLKTNLRYAHPWFGPLDAHGWAAMVAMHLGIHRNQLAIMLKTGH